MAKKYMIKNDKKCLFVSCGGRRILNVFLLTPFYYLIILFVFPYLISHF